MQASRHDENHVKNLLLWLRERAKASRKSRNDESFSDAADLIEELVYGEKRLQQQLAAAKRDGERLDLIQGLCNEEIVRAVELLAREKRHKFDAEYAIWRDANGPGR